MLWCAITSETNANEDEIRPMNSGANQRQRLLDEIDQLRRELAARQSFQRPTPGSVVHAYQELLERHYDRLDRLPSE